MSTVTVTLELTAEQAAALARFSEKTGWSEAQAVLYPHVRKEIRDGQTSEILQALDIVGRALGDCRVWPWIETGTAE